MVCGKHLWWSRETPYFIPENIKQLLTFKPRCEIWNLGPIRSSWDPCSALDRRVQSRDSSATFSDLSQTLTWNLNLWILVLLTVIRRYCKVITHIVFSRYNNNIFILFYFLQNDNSMWSGHALMLMEKSLAYVLYFATSECFLPENDWWFSFKCSSHEVRPSRGMSRVNVLLCC